MSDTTDVRLVTLPGQLRKGDVVTGTLVGPYTLTEPPVPGVIVYSGRAVPVYYLTGMALSTGYAVKDVRCARIGLDAARTIRLNGRPMPVFYRPEPAYVY